MKHFDWFGLLCVLLVIGSLGILAYAIVESDNRYKRKKTECESKGGTYLAREDACVQIQRIPLTGER